MKKYSILVVGNGGREQALVWKIQQSHLYIECILTTYNAYQPKKEFWRIAHLCKTNHIDLVVIGGDDVTVICHAEKALDFISEYIKLFQTNTKNELSNIVEKYKLDEFKNGLTACAGIAFSNEKFPFHYAVEVAESLCGEAKTLAGRDNSSVLFRNIQGSFYSSFKEYQSKELTAKKASLLYGPYYVSETNKPLLEDLMLVYNLMHQFD